MEIINSERGNPKMCFEGFMYIRKHVLKDKISWRCTKYKTKCPGKLKTDGNYENPEIVIRHNHDSNINECAVAKYVSKMKEEVSNTLAPPSKIVSEAVSQLPNEVLEMLPKQDTIKRTLRRLRTLKTKAPDDTVDVTLDGTIVKKRYKDPHSNADEKIARTSVKWPLYEKMMFLKDIIYNPDPPLSDTNLDAGSESFSDTQHSKTITNVKFDVNSEVDNSAASAIQVETTILQKPQKRKDLNELCLELQKKKTKLLESYLNVNGDVNSEIDPTPLSAVNAHADNNRTPVSLQTQKHKELREPNLSVNGDVNSEMYHITPSTVSAHAGDTKPATSLSTQESHHHKDFGERYLELQQRKIKLLEKGCFGSKQIPESADLQFFRSLIPFVEPLPPMTKLDLRNSIQQVVFEQYKKWQCTLGSDKQEAFQDEDKFYLNK